MLSLFKFLSGLFIMPKVRAYRKVESVIIAGMRIPTKVPGLRWLTVLTAVYGVLWIGFEGDVRRVLLLGTAVSLILVGHLLQRFLGGRSLQLLQWLLASGISGLLAGGGSSLLTLIFMAVKTGLHGHGPEFRPSEIEWVFGNLSLWSMAGLIAGVGIGVVIWGLGKSDLFEEA